MGKKSKKQKDSGKRAAASVEGKELSKQQKKQLMELVTQLLQSVYHVYHLRHVQQSGCLQSQAKICCRYKKFWWGLVSTRSAEHAKDMATVIFNATLRMTLWTMRSTAAHLMMLLTVYSPFCLYQDFN